MYTKYNGQTQKIARTGCKYKYEKVTAKSTGFNTPGTSFLQTRLEVPHFSPHRNDMDDVFQTMTLSWVAVTYAVGISFLLLKGSGSVGRSDFETKDCPCINPNTNYIGTRKTCKDQHYVYVKSKWYFPFVAAGYQIRWYCSLGGVGKPNRLPA